MLKTEEETIAGAGYACTQFPATAGLELEAELGKIVLPAVATAIGAVQDGLDGQLDSRLLGEAFTLAFQAIEPAALPRLALRLLAQTVRSGKPLGEEVHFNEAFSGNYGELFQALYFVVRVNRFFPGAENIGTLVRQLQARAEKKTAPKAPGSRAA